MQRLFAPGSPWEAPWAERVLPRIEQLVAVRPERTIYTRFIPAAAPGMGVGMWANYYQKWASITLDQIDHQFLQLMPTLGQFVPPAKIVDKRVYSPWLEGTLDALLQADRTNTLIITGGKTDVCVLATVLGAIDRGLRVILVVDALCSSADEIHDAVMALYLSRFSEQIKAVSMDEALDSWRA